MVRSTEAAVKRKASKVEVPAKGEDPAERKRVLNVLAQRRYRQRRKAHVKALEEQVEKVTSPSEPRTGGIPTPHQQNTTFSCTSNEGSPSNDFTAPCFINTTKSYYDPSPTNYDQAVNTDPYGPNTSSTFESLSLPTNEAFASFDPMLAGFPIWDPSVLMPSLPSTPLSPTTATTNSNPNTTPDPDWSITTVSPTANPKQPPQSDKSSHSTSPAITSTHTYPTSKPSTPRQQSPVLSPSQIPPPHVLQMHQQTNFTFPDSTNFEILDQTIYRGAMLIANRLNVEDLIWDMEALSPFCDPSASLASYTHLPPNLRPTAAQLTQPHHPIIDLLPWPNTRDKLILVLSQPESLRPKCARTPTALLEFVYDVEDTAEGVRIWGDDPYSDANWEVGELVFKNWWWAFDTGVIRRSNELKKIRGAKTLGRGTILGEIE